MHSLFLLELVWAVAVTQNWRVQITPPYSPCWWEMISSQKLQDHWGQRAASQPPVSQHSLRENKAVPPLSPQTPPPRLQLPSTTSLLPDVHAASKLKLNSGECWGKWMSYSGLSQDWEQIGNVWRPLVVYFNNWPRPSGGWVHNEKDWPRLKPRGEGCCLNLRHSSHWWEVGPLLQTFNWLKETYSHYRW